MAVIELLEQGEGFTGSDRAIASFVLAHPDESVLMSAANLAQRSHVSTGAVTRLCKKVGCSGYRDFRVRLNTEFERRRMGEGIDANVHVTTGQSSIETVADIRKVYAKAVADTSACIEALDLHDTARAIWNASKVLMYGIGDSLLACNLFAIDLLRIGITPIDAMRGSLCWAHSNLVRRDDVGLFVSYSGNWFPDLVKYMELIRKAQGRVIIVSSREADLELRSHADFVLKLPVGEDIRKSAGTLYSRVCTQYLLSCLYATVYSFDSTHNDEVRSRVVSPWAEGWQLTPHLGGLPL